MDLISTDLRRNVDLGIGTGELLGVSNTRSTFPTSSTASGSHVTPKRPESKPVLTRTTSSYSLVEANLLVICGSMTTIRRFLTNVAPRVLGDSPYGTKTDPNAPRTKTRSYRSTPNQRKHQYSRFGSSREEDEIEFQVLSQMGAKKHSGGGSKGVVMGVGTTTIEGGGPQSPTWEDRPRGEDDDSEKAIVQTKTVTVRYD